MKPRLFWFALLSCGFAHAQETAPEPPAAADPVETLEPAPENEARPVAPPRSGPVRPAGPIEVNGIAATVNGISITKTQVGLMLAPIYNQLAAQFPRRGPEFERQVLEAREKILQELIDREIILWEFKELAKKGANLPDHVVDQEIKRQIRETHNGDKALFEEELKRAHMTTPAYRKMVRNQLIVQAMRAERFSDAPPPMPREVQKEYDEVKDTLRDITKDKITFNKIFLPRQDPQSPASLPEDQLQLAEELTARIKSGSDFAELAKANSRDAYAAQGGFQADLPRTDLAPEFAAIIFAGKAGDVLGPLEDPLGFTIVKIVEIKKGPAPPLSEVREMIEERVRRKKSSAVYEKWIQEKRKTAMITRKI